MKKIEALKFARHSGNNYTYVLEYAPQVRSIIMSGFNRSFGPTDAKPDNLLTEQAGFWKKFGANARQNVLGKSSNYALSKENLEKRKEEKPKKETQNPLTAYRLAFPYLTFIINFKGREYDKTVVGVRNTPLESVDDTICRLPMSNVYRQPKGMGLCMTVPREDCPPSMSVVEKIESVVNLFWFTRFGGTHPHIPQKVDPRVSNYNAWKACTKRNEKFITTIDWVDPGHTVRELMDLMPDSGHCGEVTGFGGMANRGGKGEYQRFLEWRNTEEYDGVVEEEYQYNPPSTHGWGQKDPKDELGFKEDEGHVGKFGGLSKLMDDIKNKIL